MDLGDEHQLLIRSTREFLARRAPLAQLHTYESKPELRDEVRWKEIAALGWIGLAVPADLGGAGGTLVEMELVCEELGRVLFPEPFIAVAVAAQVLGHSSGERGRSAMADLLEGRSVIIPAVGESTVRWDRVAGHDPPDRLSGTIRFVEGASRADGLLVPVVAHSGKAQVALVPTADPGVVTDPVDAMVNGYWSHVELHRAEPLDVIARPEVFDDAITTAAVMHAAWCAGAATRLVEDTSRYACDRVQFGVPIGSFQAVQHNLADASICATESVNLARQAAAALIGGDQAARRFVSTAFVRATEGFVEVARRCHQTWGGMGFSTDSHVHHYSRRAKMAAQAWGGKEFHLDRLAAELTELPLVRDRYAGSTRSTSTPQCAVPTGPARPGVQAFRDKVRAFLVDAIDPIIPSQGSFPQGDTAEKKAFIAKLAQRGWLGLAWKPEHGGAGRDPAYQLVLQQELEYAGMPSSSIEVAMLGPTLMRHGSERLKGEFLSRIARGELTMALGYSEPEAGSDLANLALRARRDGDVYVLNGQKMWTSAAHFADVIWLACRTDSSGPTHRGISILLVDTASPGITVTPISTMAEHRTNMVFFDDVRVPAYRLVGEEGRAWTYLMEALDFERLAGFPTGAFVRDIDELVAWARNDERWVDPRFRRELARWVVRAAGALSHHTVALDLLSHGVMPTIAATMLKVSLTEARQDLADWVLDVLGPSGLVCLGSDGAVMDGRFEATWRAEIITSIAGGANELQRNIVAQRHLGLPRTAT